MHVCGELSSRHKTMLTLDVCQSSCPLHKFNTLVQFNDSIDHHSETVVHNYIVEERLSHEIN